MRGAYGFPTRIAALSKQKGPLGALFLKNGKEDECMEIMEKLKKYLSDEEQLCLESWEWENVFNVIFLENIIEDLKMVNLCIQLKYSEKYITLITRQIIEQISIYNYIMHDMEKAGNLINDFFGGNIEYEDFPDEKNLEELTGKELLDYHKAILGKRTKSYKNNFKELIETFEVKEKNKEDSLYNLYAVLSDQVHNSYFINNRFRGSFLDNENNGQLDKYGIYETCIDEFLSMFIQFYETSKSREKVVK